jgi:selenocysteine lyase/cysteine desulfurase
VSTSVSEAIAGVASSLDYTRRTKVVTTEAEFPTVGQVWLAHQRFGPTVEFVPVRDGRLYLEDYERLIDENTACVSVTHVYYQNGFRQDISPITELAHKKGALVCVDDYQSCGTFPIDVKALGVDFLTSGNLKYLLGVPGIAFLYVKKDIVEGMRPAVTGWFGQQEPFSFKVKELKYADSARRYDTGTPAVMPAFAARAGMEIINEVGPDRIQMRIEHLSRYTLAAAREAGFDITSPQDVTVKGATNSFRVEDSHGVEAAMKKRGIIASARGDVIRFAPHFFTTEADIDTAVSALKEVLNK